MTIPDAPRIIKGHERTLKRAPKTVSDRLNLKSKEVFFSEIAISM